MIFYFSGTGNSLDTAKRIGERFHDEKLVSIAEYTKKASDKKPPFSFSLEQDEKVFLVFPIYAWGPPKPVLDFIDNLSLVNDQGENVYAIENTPGNSIYAVATCGKNIGNTMNVLQKHLARKGYNLDSGFSLVMPNNYILAGDVNTKEEEKTILIEAEVTLRNIMSRIENGEHNIFLVEKGPVPFLLTGVIHPAFTNQPFKAKAFYATDACNHCGICVKVCNCGNIELKDGKPVWGSDCVQCLACIHYCPARAIQYGKATLNKGRYINPNVKK